MKVGRVVGTVVSTINAPVFDGRTLLLCDLLEPTGEPAGGYVIAIDTVGAGAGETVLILDEGNSARQVIGLSGAPIRTLVVGIIDAIVAQAAAGGGPVPGRPPKPRARASRPPRARDARQEPVSDPARARPPR